MLTDKLLEYIQKQTASRIELEDYNFRDEDLGALVKALNNNLSITELSLKNNNFREPKLLCELLYVEKLDISYNNINDSCAVALAEKFKEVNLSCNNLSKEVVEALAKVTEMADTSLNPGSV